MKFYTIIPPGLFAIVFLWALGNFLCAPDAPEPPPEIKVLHRDQSNDASYAR